MARFFIEHYNGKFKRQIDGLSPEAESLLLAHDWPGNVRELEHVLERGAILAGNEAVLTSSEIDFGFAVS
jgi:transcriptional regulator with PAS, ATPase and Fis domain